MEKTINSNIINTTDVYLPIDVMSCSDAMSTSDIIIMALLFAAYWSVSFALSVTATILTYNFLMATS